MNGVPRPIYRTNIWGSGDICLFKVEHHGWPQCEVVFARIQPNSFLHCNWQLPTPWEVGYWGLSVITVTPREGKYLSVVRGRNGEPSEPCAGQLRADWGWSVHIQQPACSWNMQVTGCYALMPSLAEMLPKSGARFVSLHHTTLPNPLPKSEKKIQHSSQKHTTASFSGVFPPPCSLLNGGQIHVQPSYLRGTRQSARGSATLVLLPLESIPLMPSRASRDRLLEVVSSLPFVSLNKQQLYLLTVVPNRNMTDIDCACDDVKSLPPSYYLQNLSSRQTSENTPRLAHLTNISITPPSLSGRIQKSIIPETPHLHLLDCLQRKQPLKARKVFSVLTNSVGV
ncbi:hypothetical protein QC764_505048 [Podospora pseudoanserina]|uniref:Uncharacterized protein n=1 Tax=Podospora pseudoanserina TaxID=2609844 RepID=A0ABR0I5U1_9PEZI|nr:hypothetical protein QC764_505048 [Podospora pseudoanserina]